MTDTSEKVRENRLRRMARRQGYRLSKSRVRDPRALNYGTWLILPDETQGRRGLGIECRNIDEVEAFLAGEADDE